MNTTIENLEIAVPDEANQLTVYIARPSIAGHYSVIIIAPEILGVNAHIKKVANEIAALGYIVAAPDFYYRTAPGTALGYTPEDRDKGMSLLKLLKRDEVVKDVQAVMGHLHFAGGTTGKTGIVGFSMGGHIAYLVSTKLNIAATVCLYAGWLTNTEIGLGQPEPTISLTAGIKGEVLFFAGGKDPIITADQREQIERSLTDAKVPHLLIVYPDATHGFFCEERDNWFHKPSRDDAMG